MTPPWHGRDYSCLGILAFLALWCLVWPCIWVGAVILEVWEWART